MSRCPPPFYENFCTQQQGFCQVQQNLVDEKTKSLVGFLARKYSIQRNRHFWGYELTILQFQTLSLCCLALNFSWQPNFLATTQMKSRVNLKSVEAWIKLNCCLLVFSVCVIQMLWAVKRKKKQRVLMEKHVQATDQVTVPRPTKTNLNLF